MHRYMYCSSLNYNGPHRQDHNTDSNPNATLIEQLTEVSQVSQCVNNGEDYYRVPYYLVQFYVLIKRKEK